MKKLSRRNALTAIAAIPAVSLPADPIFRLIEAHEAALQEWERVGETESEFREKFASQHREALAAEKVEEALDEAEWADRKVRAAPVAEEILRAIPEENKVCVLTALADFARADKHRIMEAEVEAKLRRGELHRYPNFNSSPEHEAYEDLSAEAQEREHDAELALLTTPPTTLAGVAACWTI
jgi:hypothetical protein